MRPNVYTRLLKNRSKVLCSGCRGKIRIGDLVVSKRGRRGNKIYHLKCWIEEEGKTWKELEK